MANWLLLAQVAIEGINHQNLVYNVRRMLTFYYRKTFSNKPLKEQTHLLMIVKEGASPFLSVRNSQLSYRFHTNCAYDEAHDTLIYSSSLGQITYQNCSSKKERSRRLKIGFRHHEPQAELEIVRKGRY